VITGLSPFISSIQYITAVVLTKYITDFYCPKHTTRSSLLKSGIDIKNFCENAETCSMFRAIKDSLKVKF
jgi:hypothetical protein